MSNKNLITYIIDWITVALLIIPYLIFPKLSPHKRNFSITDESISHQYLGTQQISDMQLILIAAIVPVIIGFIVIALTKGKLNDYNHFLLALCTCIGITVDFSEFIKNLFGRYRPDFLSRCQIDYNKVNALISEQFIVDGLPVGEKRLFDMSICSNPNEKVLDEGRRSFPSGHASTISAAFVFLTLFLAGKLRLYNHHTQIWRIIVCCLPIFGAIYVMATRHQDNLHHWSDLVGGAILGTVIDLIVYRFFYPSVTSNCSNKQYKYKNNILNNEGESTTDGGSPIILVNKETSKVV